MLTHTTDPQPFWLSLVCRRRLFFASSVCCRVFTWLKCKTSRLFKLLAPLVVACDLARLLSIVVATQSTEAEHSSVVSHKVPLNPLLWSTRATTAEGGRVLCVGRRRASEQTLADQKTHRRGEEWHKNIRESSRRRNLQDFFPLPLCALSAQTNNRRKKLFTMSIHALISESHPPARWRRGFAPLQMWGGNGRSRRESNEKRNAQNSTKSYTMKGEWSKTLE